MMSWSGSFTPGLRDRMPGIAPPADPAQEDVRQGGSIELQSRLSGRGQVIGGHHRAEHGGNMEHVSLDRASIWASVIGASEAPKSTVPSLNCRMPPPEPIDW